jgi:hypothetical protein
MYDANMGARVYVSVCEQGGTMPDEVTWTLYRLDEPEENYVVLPNDGTRGLFVGDYWDLDNLRHALSQEPSGVIPPDHEQLGFEHLYTHEACSQYNVNMRTLQWACKRGKVEGAARGHRGMWRFSRRSFLKWFASYRGRR